MRIDTGKAIYLFICILCTQLTVYAQDNPLKQNVHGYVTDAESKQPLEGVTIILLSDNQVNTFSDSDGYFVLYNVPIGRQAFRFSFTGYETRTVSEILVTSGKETELNISLSENYRQLKEVKISARKNRSQALNEFATVSARSFSVEETRRYAASISDPARMAMNFAGVANNGDLENDIVVRGNSPRGVLWRLEGIEIPNPNHFSELGNSGGAVSMINANMLGTSDFYTGAFPAEIGNALSGAFDLNMRNGNKDKYEHIFQIGLLGTEVATEGPFRKGGKASYLVDFRYSTLALVQDYLSLNGLIPNYKDINLKINLPTNKMGTFSVFGIGGTNTVQTDPEPDSTKWNSSNQNAKIDNRSNTGITGISNQFFVKRNAYIKTILSATYSYTTEKYDTLNTLKNYAPEHLGSARYHNNGMRLSVLYNEKMNDKNTLRTGVIVQQLSYDVNRDFYRFGTVSHIYKLEGSTQFYQAYAQWKSRLSQRMTLIGGAHASYFALNSKYSIEPRASLSYTMRNSKFTLAAGLHSKPDHISTYLYTDSAKSAAYLSNRNLDLLRAFHSVLAYDVGLPYKIHFKAELYYQYLYHIPVEQDTSTGFSVLNTQNVYALYGTKPLISTGTGQNYGIDLVLERPFADDYYVLLTGSLYRSTYTTYKGESYQGHYDRTYQLNVVGGKEFYLSRKKRSLIGVNGKIVFSGGQRESEIDLARSIREGRTVYLLDQYYSLQDPYYLRIDGGLYYKLNNKKATHVIELNVQNVTNRRNFSYSYFDTRSNTIQHMRETGLIPALSYRIEFHR